MSRTKISPQMKVVEKTQEKCRNAKHNGPNLSCTKRPRILSQVRKSCSCFRQKPCLPITALSDKHYSDFNEADLEESSKALLVPLLHFDSIWVIGI